MKIMASSPITSWQIDKETMKTVTDFIFLGSKITADSDCSHSMKRCFLYGRKAMTNLDSILKAMTLPTKICIVKAMVSQVVMYGCERWTIKKAEHERIDAFELWCWRRLLRVPCTTKRSNQSTLKESILSIHWKDWCWSSSNWLPDAKGQLIRKDPQAGKDWKQEEDGMTEDVMVGWHHWLYGHEFE